MQFETPLVTGTLIGRRKRFLADVRLADGREVVAHCPNSGRMTACLVPGGEVWLSPANNPKRKLKWTWEIALGGDDGAVPILVNTARPNRIVAEGILAGKVACLQGYEGLRTEVKYDENSRCDIVLDGAPPRYADTGSCYVEVKNVTLWTGGRTGAFPDAVSVRGKKHLGALQRVVEAGGRAVLAYLVSRGDIDVVRPADHVDPAYGVALRQAAAAGVEVIAMRAVIDRRSVLMGKAIEVDLSA
jgi:sugar fermentation stimulation protein A